MKKILSVFLAAAMVATLCSCAVSVDTGDSSSKASSAVPSGDTSKPFAGQTIEIAERYTGTVSEAFAEIAKAFEAETGSTVMITEYGDDYENMMKTRMASNKLPDIFETHGWSILRYKEYLMDLQNEKWASDLDESARGVIEDANGEIYVLMISEITNGVLVNLEVCKAAGVDPYAISTWEDFTKACEKIKAAGYTPIGEACGGGNLANISGTWVNYKGSLSEDSAAMLDGTYDWKSYRPFLEQYSKWLDAGFFFEDYATMKPTDASERFSKNLCAFWLGNDPQFLAGCKRLNAEGDYALVPTFTSKTGGSRFIGIGEGETFGIWKDTAKPELAKAFLEFMAKPENVVKLTDASGSIACLKSSMDVSGGYGLQVFKTMQEKCADVELVYENLWDRKYMPSGMWPIFTNGLKMLIEKHDVAGIDATLAYLSENYVDLYEAAKAG